jgi:hypothetical protein
VFVLQYPFPASIPAYRPSSPLNTRTLRHNERTILTADCASLRQSLPTAVVRTIEPEGNCHHPEGEMGSFHDHIRRAILPFAIDSDSGASLLVPKLAALLNDDGAALD